MRDEGPAERPFGVVFFWFHCVGSVAVGGVIYIAFRDDALLMFDWAEALGLLPAVRSLRSVTLPYGQWLPSWVLYSVPDGAWVYACTAFFARLWRDGPTLPRLAWTLIGPALAIGGEFAQLPVVGWVPGTFDPVDLVCYGLAGLAAWAVATRWP